MSKLVGKLRDDAAFRLFCFPFAGGGGSAFREWQAAFPAWLQVCPIHLPGRERRIAEPQLTDLLPAVPGLVADLLPFLDRPYAFFGHSMGTLFALELARGIEATGGPRPEVVYLSGYRSPQFQAAAPVSSDMTDAEFVQFLKTLGGMPEAVLAEPGLVEAMLPIIRADFGLCERHRYVSGVTLSCPLEVLGGEGDTNVPRDQLDGWRDFTTGPCRVQQFPGDHFFFAGRSRDQVFEFLVRDVSARRAAATAVR